MACAAALRLRSEGATDRDGEARGDDSSRNGDRADRVGNGERSAVRIGCDALCFGERVGVREAGPEAAAAEASLIAIGSAAVAHADLTDERDRFALGQRARAVGVRFALVGAVERAAVAGTFDAE